MFHPATPKCAPSPSHLPRLFPQVEARQARCLLPGTGGHVMFNVWGERVPVLNRWPCLSLSCFHQAQMVMVCPSPSAFFPHGSVSEGCAPRLGSHRPQAALWHSTEARLSGCGLFSWESVRQSDLERKWSSSLSLTALQLLSQPTEATYWGSWCCLWEKILTWKPWVLSRYSLVRRLWVIFSEHLVCMTRTVTGPERTYFVGFMSLFFPLKNLLILLFFENKRTK